MEETIDAGEESFPNYFVEQEEESNGDKVDEEEEGREGSKKSRVMCWSGCGRPASVCLCAHLPPQPLLTATTILVLHHPHELRRNPLATLPFLLKSLHRCHPIPGRRLRLGSHPLLDSLHHNARSAAVAFLFPGGQDIALFAAAESRPVVLIVFDGTWKQAKEMVAASLPFLERFVTRVSLGGGGCKGAADGPSTFESELVLRKEPFEGCTSTMEAVARALRVLEPGGRGEEVEARLLSVLRAMVRFQASHLKPTKPRPKLKRKEMITDNKKEEEKVIQAEEEQQ